MKTLITLHHRLTHDYAQGWAHEDRWVYIGPARRTEPRRISRDEEGGHLDRLLVTFSPAQLQQAKRVWRRVRSRRRGHPFHRFLENAIAEAFTYSCQCEHDCCGHPMAWAVVDRKGPREYLVEIQTTRNL